MRLTCSSTTRALCSPAGAATRSSVASRSTSQARWQRRARWCRSCRLEAAALSICPRDTAAWRCCKRKAARITTKWSMRLMWTRSCVCRTTGATRSRAPSRLEARACLHTWCARAHVAVHACAHSDARLCGQMSAAVEGNAEPCNSAAGCIACAGVSQHSRRRHRPGMGAHGHGRPARAAQRSAGFCCSGRGCHSPCRTAA